MIEYVYNKDKGKSAVTHCHDDTKVAMCEIDANLN